MKAVVYQLDNDDGALLVLFSSFTKAWNHAMKGRWTHVMDCNGDFRLGIKKIVKEEMNMNGYSSFIVKEWTSGDTEERVIWKREIH